MTEVQKADRRARLTALTVIGCGAVLGMVLLGMIEERRSDLEAWLRADVQTRLPIVLGATAMLTVFPLCGLAAYLWLLGRRVVSALRYPPAGMKLLRDIPVVTNRAAKRRGRQLQAIAVVVVSVALFMTLLLWRLYVLILTVA